MATRACPEGSLIDSRVERVESEVQAGMVHRAASIHTGSHLGCQKREMTTHMCRSTDSSSNAECGRQSMHAVHWSYQHSEAKSDSFQSAGSDSMLARIDDTGESLKQDHLPG